MNTNSRMTGLFGENTPTTWGGGIPTEESIFINGKNLVINKVEMTKNEYGEVTKFSETSYKYDEKGRKTEIYVEVKDRQNPENNYTHTTT